MKIHIVFMILLGSLFFASIVEVAEAYDGNVINVNIPI